MFELLCALVLQDEAADLLQALSEKAQKAKSLRVSVRFAYSEAGPPAPVFDVELRAKGEKRWLFETTTNKGDGLEESIRASCDGVDLSSRGFGSERREARNPERYTRQLREWCATSFMPAFMSLVYKKVDMGDNNFPAISGAKLLGREKVGEVDARVVEYTLTYPTRTTSRVRAWIDPLQKRPLKRLIANGQGGGFEETITAFEIDPETPDALFVTPDPTDVEEARNRLRTIALRRIHELRRGVEQFGGAEGRFPTSAEGLDALLQKPAGAKNWKGPYVDEPEILRDPWGNVFTYRYPGARDPERYEIVSPVFEGKDALPLAKLRELLAEDTRHTELLAAFKELAGAQKRFMEDDLDGNGETDFWVGDVSGLYRFPREGAPIQLIQKEIADADASPLRAKPLGESWPLKARPYRGYYFAVLRKQEGALYHEGSFRNPERFGIVAWPAEYPKGGRLTLILNDGGGVWERDLGGKPVDAWPSGDDEPKWRRSSD